ncbi:MAG: hypothetical protein HRU70_00275 [Phycisphaeraceae bacterium]|nr:MAG: hypothetical protein HRU70_00275 [Phycisphaeraceae bacterium]
MTKRPHTARPSDRAANVVTALLIAHAAGLPAALAQPGTGPGTTAGATRISPPNGPIQEFPGGGKDPSDVAADSALSRFNSDPASDPLSQPRGGAGRAGKDDRMSVRVDANMLVDLHVQDEDLASVLEMLSIQSQRNIIASKDVSARVTANFYGVTFHQALDAILHANGFGYIEKDNFIYIYTGEQLEAIMRAQMKKVSKVISLNYLNAIDAAEMVKASLSDTGQIKTPGKTQPFPSSSNVPFGADEYVNNAVLVITDYEDNIRAVEELLRQLDTRPAQVLVEATILQTSLNEANAFGVDFAVISDIEFSDFVGVGGPLKIVDALIANNSERLTGGSSGDLPAASGNDGGGFVSSPGNTAGPATMKFGYINNDVGVFLRVLDEVSDTTVLSNPKILALNRQPARVLVGQRVGYLSTTSTDTATTQTVEFLDTGTQLHFRPFVSDDGVIRMELKPQVSTAVVRDVRNSTGSVVTVPDEITNELNTNVMVRDGQTVVLGGLFRDRTKATKRQVPLLGDIPLLGEAFKGHDTEVERTEIIFLITPTIVNDQALASAGQRGVDTVERVRAGSRNGLLDFSREKRSSQLLIEASRLADAGDTQKALWKIEQALALNPIMPEAIALKERLTGERTVWPHRSLLEGVIHGEADRAAPRSSNDRAVPAATRVTSNAAWMNALPVPPVPPSESPAAASAPVTVPASAPVFEPPVTAASSEPLAPTAASAMNTPAAEVQPNATVTFTTTEPAADRADYEGRMAFEVSRELAFAFASTVYAAAARPDMGDQPVAVKPGREAQLAEVATALETLNTAVAKFHATTGRYPDFAGQGWGELVNAGLIETSPVNPLSGFTSVVIGPSGMFNSGWHWDPQTKTLGATFFDEDEFAFTPDEP